MSALTRVKEDLLPATVSTSFIGAGSPGSGPFSPPGGSNGESAQDINADAVERKLVSQIGLERYELWFEGKTQFRMEGEILEVTAGNPFAAKWIRTKFEADLRAVAQQVLGRNVEIRVVVAEAGQGTPARGPSGDVPTSANGTSPSLEAAHAGQTGPVPNRQRSGPVLNPRYTLEEFVVGVSNQLCYHAAVRVAEHPGQQFNPLFIHGACGLGKTHLLQAICQRFAKLHPTKKWLYLTGEQFTNEFLEAIKTHKTEAFRRKIRGTDLLVIDDIHFLANKKATQEEFLHTFNQIDGGAGGKQVVLASDCAPKAIAAMTEGLVSRFVSGMVLRMDPPDLTTRLSILRRNVARHHWRVSDAVLMHIASNSSSSVRELEGLLLQAVAGISLMPGPTSKEGAMESVIAGLRERNAAGRSPIAVEKIIVVVAAHFGVSEAAILGSGREKTVSLARSLAMYLARRHTGMSYPEIGRAMGNKNHSTVIAACQRVEAMIISGDLLYWKMNNEIRHQTMTDALHELEAAIKRRP